MSIAVVVIYSSYIPLPHIILLILCLMHDLYICLYPVPAITVNISDGGVVPTAGTSFRLICNIFGAESLEASITYKWKTSNSTHTYVINNSNTLFFGSLQLLDSKEYSCEVTVKSPYLEYNITNTSSYQLLLERKFGYSNSMNKCIIYLNFHISQFQLQIT